MQHRFLRLAPPRFSHALEEDVYEFLIAFKERLYKLGLVKTRFMDYTKFQLDLEARPWQRGHLYSNLDGSFTLIRTQFFKVFWEKYMPRSLRDHLRDQLSREMVSMKIMQSKV